MLGVWRSATMSDKLVAVPDYRLSAIGYRLLSQEVIRIDIDRDLHLVGQS
jgi:hypothetical protein